MKKDIVDNLILVNDNLRILASTNSKGMMCGEENCAPIIVSTIVENTTLNSVFFDEFKNENRIVVKSPEYTQLREKILTEIYNYRDNKNKTLKGLDAAMFGRQ